MEFFVDRVAGLIETHQMWAGPLVGLLAFGESLALVGILLPGTAVLVIVGGLIGAGVVHPLPVLVCALIGAVLGDIVSYLLGVWLGRGVVHKWPLNQYREAVARARLFFRRYGIAAIFLGRFFGPVRATVPLVAGMMGMDWRRFQIANVLSALVWTPVVLSPGWLAAKGMAHFVEMSEGEWLGLAAVALAAATVAAIAGAKLLRRGVRRRRARVVRRGMRAE